MHWPLHSLERTWASQLPQSMLTRTFTAHGDPSLAAPMLTTRFSYTRGYGGACTSYIALYTVRATQAHSHPYPWDRSRSLSSISVVWTSIPQLSTRFFLRVISIFPAWALQICTAQRSSVTGVTASTIEDFHSTRRPVSSSANAHCQV